MAAPPENLPFLPRPRQTDCFLLGPYCPGSGVGSCLDLRLQERGRRGPNMPGSAVSGRACLYTGPAHLKFLLCPGGRQFWAMPRVQWNWSDGLRGREVRGDC